MYLKRSLSKLIAGLFVASLATGLVAAHDSESSDDEATKTQDVLGKMGEFTLTSAHGPVSLKDLRGKVVLIFFGYTSCPDVCPLTLATIDRVFSGMRPEELTRSKALFISLDPERDTPEKLEQYTSYFNDQIIGLTDNHEVLTKVAGYYGVTYQKKPMPDSALGYTIFHSTDIFLLDENGVLRDTFPHNSSATPLISRIRELLNVQ